MYQSPSFSVWWIESGQHEKKTKKIIKWLVNRRKQQSVANELATGMRKEQGNARDGFFHEQSFVTRANVA